MGYHFDQRWRLYPASARDVARRLNSGCNGEDQGAERNADFNGDCNDLTNSNRADHHLDSNLHASACDANANHDSRIFNAYIAANILHADIVTADPAEVEPGEINAGVQHGALVILGVFVVFGILIRLRRS